MRMNPAQFGLSKYVHTHDVEDTVTALYLSLSQQVRFLMKKDVDALQRKAFAEVPPQVLQDLAGHGFLVSHEFDDQILDRYAQPPEHGFISLWLILTDTCNMACRYCVVDAPEGACAGKKGKNRSAPSRRMTPEVANAAIELFGRALERQASPFAKVTLYGGEPLLNKEVLAHALPRLRALRWRGQRQPLDILCFTNGLVYDQEITDVFRQCSVNVGVSLDGLERHHDRSRVLANGAGTFKKVKENLERYQAAGLNVGLSCTIGSHNCTELHDIASYFGKELGIRGMQLQAPIQTANGANPLYVDMADAAEESWNAYLAMRDLGLEEGLALRRLSSFLSGRFHHRDCLAVGGELAVDCDGTIGPCHNATQGGRQFFQGNVMDPGIVPERLPGFAEWHSRLPVNMRQCRDCSLIGLCGGGCPYNALVSRGSIWEIDPQLCGYLRKFSNLLLEDMWRNSQRHAQVLHQQARRRDSYVQSQSA